MTGRSKIPEMANVKLTLVDLTSHVVEDEKNKDTSDALRELLDETLAYCMTAQDILFLRQMDDRKPYRCCRTVMSPSPSSIENGDDVRARLRGRILRYLKCADKYTALTSLLLKSQAFHLAYPANDTLEEMLPVVELPLTEHGKPFIPAPRHFKRVDSLPGTAEDAVFPFSVSHQYPFVGLARFQNHVSLPFDSVRLEENKLKLGLDIVMFTERNEKLYETEQDFIDVFRGSFTDWEWSRIQAHEEHLLHEFYLRWAIKEAYTKALGLGMGIDFASFETRLPVIDSDPEERSLWTSIAGGNGSWLRGTVSSHQGSGKELLEFWDFSFLPLCDANGEVVGCSCTCLGPLCSRETSSSPALEFSSLNDLAKWHEERR